MNKNEIYQINNKKMVCILCDDEFACLCPIYFHSDDNGYSIKISKSEIYSQRIEVAEVEAVGIIRNNEARTFLGVPLRQKRKAKVCL